MTTEVYMLALDLVVIGDKIKILEIQSLYDSDLDHAQEVTGSHPNLKLKPTMQRFYPELRSLEEPEVKEIQDYAQKSSRLGRNNNIPNRGIQALMTHKWLFYGVCNQFPALKEFIPETYLVTAHTLATAFDVEKLKEKPYLIKPASFAKGIGIVRIPSSIKTIDELTNFIKKQKFYEQMTTIPEFREHIPLVIQEYLHSGVKKVGPSKPSVRVYLGAVWRQQGGESELKTWSDGYSAYESSRKKDDPEDFTLENSRHKKFDISEISPEISKFINTFFNELLCQQSRVTLNYWGLMAKEYVRHAHSMCPPERIHLLTLMFQALDDEMDYTLLKLAPHQCMLLIAFFETFNEHDLAVVENRFFAKRLTDAFRVIHQISYDTNNAVTIRQSAEVLVAYEQALSRVKMPEKGLSIGDMLTWLQGIKAFTNNNQYFKSASYKVGFFDYLTHEDKLALSATSKAKLRVCM